MTATVLGWLITAYADHGELILAAGVALAAGWASYRLTTRGTRRAAARDAEAAARPTSDSTDVLEQLWQLPATTHRNTRKENRP